MKAKQPNSKDLLSIVIPVWNEEKTLRHLIETVLKVKFPKNVDLEVVMINDASSDKTPQIAQDLAKKHKAIVYLNNEKNLGKSQTVKKGVMASKGDLVVIQDADLEYDPNELAGIYEVLRSRELDVVYGNRFGQKNKVIYWQNYLGNRFLSFVSNIFTYPRLRVWIPDMEVCHKMIRGDVARDIGKGLVSKSSFGLEPEITAKLSRYKINGKHLKFGIVTTSYDARSIEEGKKMNAVKDGLKALREIVVFNLKP